MRVLMQGKMGDKGTDVVIIDPSTLALVTVDYAHKEIHGGDGYLLSYNATKGDGEDIEIRIGTPDTDKHAHMEIMVNGQGETDVDFYEGTTLVHAGGNALTPINRNRNSAKTSGLTMCHTPTGSGDGNLLVTVDFGLDTGVGANRSFAGGSAGGRNEIVLKRNTAYLLRVTSGTAGNRISIQFNWYEHTPKN